MRRLLVDNYQGVQCLKVYLMQLTACLKVKIELRFQLQRQIILLQLYESDIGCFLGQGWPEINQYEKTKITLWWNMICNRSYIFILNLYISIFVDFKILVWIFCFILWVYEKLTLNLRPNLVPRGEYKMYNRLPCGQILGCECDKYPSIMLIIERYTFIKEKLDRFNSLYF